MLNSKALWWSLLIVWIAGSAYWHVCKILELCDTELFVTVAEVPVVKVVTEPLTISDAFGLILRSKGNFAFAKGGIIANKSDVYPQMDSLALYLASHPDKLLTITGLYSSQEINSTIFPDLGLARASEIKNWFLGKGISDSMFLLSSKLKEDIVFNNDSLRGGIHFTFSSKIAPLEAKLANEQKYESIFTPFDLYFPASDPEYTATEESRKFMEEAKKYLLKNKDKELILTVYSDDKDTTELNRDLFRKRIGILKKPFILSGLSASRIVTEVEKRKFKKDTVLAESQADDRVTIVVR